MSRNLKSPPGISEYPKPPLPLDYMLGVMADETASPARRDEMARMAAPYLHAKAEATLKAPKRAKTKSSLLEPDDENDSHADPIIRTAKSTLKRKLARLAAKGTDLPAD